LKPFMNEAITSIAQEAVVRALRAAEAFSDEKVEIVLLHVNGGALPQLQRPERRYVPGKNCAARSADVIVMRPPAGIDS
jgi:hypothetical protein